MIKNKKLQGIIIGMIIGTFFSSSIGFVLADPIQKQITATYNGIKIFIDGNEISPKDAAGNVVEPFIYEGTTYLPVRAVGEAFDKKVSWDGEAQSVYIGWSPQKDEPVVDVSTSEFIKSIVENAQEQISSLEESMGNILDIKIYAKGNTIVYSYKYTIDLGEISFIKPALEKELEKQKDTFEGILRMLNAQKVSSPSIIIEYYTNDNQLILSHEFK